MKKQILLFLGLFFTVMMQGAAPVNNALSFDGIDDYVALPSSSLLNFTGTASLSVTAWVNPASANAPICTKWMGNFHTLSFSFNISGNKVYLGFDDYNNGGWQTVTSTASIPANKWTHVAFTLINGVVKVYINGVYDSGLTFDNNHLTAATSIGAINIGGKGLLTGWGAQTLDEVSIWNKGLSATEISAVAGAPSIVGTETGLLAYYNFNQGVAGAGNSTVTSLTDAVVTGFNGVLTNFALTGTSSNWVSGYNLPTVTTQDVTGIGPNTATGNGNNVGIGSPNPTQYGVVWSTTSNPTVALTTKTTQGAATIPGAFTSSITGLTANTNYYVRAYATNMGGTSYGAEVTFTTLPTPKNGLSFDGIDDYVALPSSPLLNFTGTASLSVTAWVNPASANAPICTKWMGNFHTLSFSFNISGNKVYLGFDDYNNGGWQTVTSTASIPANKWTHVAFTLINGVVRVYINGVYDSGLTFDNNHLTATTSIGAINIGGKGLLTGWGAQTLDEVSIWNKGLSATEILVIAGAPSIVGTEAGLLAYYNFNQGVAGAGNSAVTSLTDAVVNGLNGTLTNFALTGTTSNWMEGFVNANPLGVNNPKAALLSMYPNPATDHFSINAGEQTNLVSIYDLTGSLVLSQPATKETNINIESLQQGIYVIKANGLIGKLIKK